MTILFTVNTAGSIVTCNKYTNRREHDLPDLRWIVQVITYLAWVVRTNGLQSMYQSCLPYRSSRGNVNRSHRSYQFRQPRAYKSPATRMVTWRHALEYSSYGNTYRLIIHQPHRNLCKWCRSIQNDLCDGCKNGDRICETCEQVTFSNNVWVSICCLRLSERVHATSYTARVKNRQKQWVVMCGERPSRFCDVPRYPDKLCLSCDQFAYMRVCYTLVLVIVRLMQLSSWVDFFFFFFPIFLSFFLTSPTRKRFYRQPPSRQAVVTTWLLV